MRPRPWIVVLIAGLLVLAGFFATHRDYYLASLHEQVHHAEHGLLRSSRAAGLGFGVCGASLVVMNLSYLVRRRLARRRGLGSLRTWMDFHVATGLFAAACIVLHAACGLRSSMGTMAAFSFFVVVLAGLIGRYIYAQVPRSIEGRELRLDEVRRTYAGLLESLRDSGISTDFETDRHAAPRSKIRTLGGLLLGSPELRRQFRAARRRLAASAVDEQTVSRALPVLRRLVRARSRLERYGELQSLMASWRFLHRWLALVMIGAVVVHVITALRYASLSFSRGGG